MQNIFTEVQVPTWQAIARGEAEGNSLSSRYLHRGENVLYYCLFKLEITVLLPINYIYSHVTYHVTRQLTAGQAIEFSIAWYYFMLLPC